MKKITCVYTGMGALPASIEALFKKEIGDVKFHHILDSGLIADIIAADGVTPLLEKRIYALYDAAAATEADIIVATCSSIGAVTEKYAKQHPEVNIMRIDYPMAKYAAENASRVAVLATLSTTVSPSKKLVERLAAEAGKKIEVVNATAPGAFDALIGGDMPEATARVLKTARELCKDADVVLLAQASMSNFKEELQRELGETAVLLESPSTCADYLKKNL